MIAESYYQNASEVRKNWSMTIDSVVHERPAFIHRTHDKFMMMDSALTAELLRDYKYHVSVEEEEDGSVTGYVEELQLVENADTYEDMVMEDIVCQNGSILYTKVSKGSGDTQKDVGKNQKSAVAGDTGIFYMR